MEMNLEKLNKILNNSQNVYHGHGTSGDDIITSIFDNGLRCSHGSMYFTTCALGKGGELDNEVLDTMNNWPHLQADKIVIISLPIKYNILDAMPLGTYNLGTNAFYYDVEGNDKLSQGKYVMPEFIVGCYDSNTKTFEKNNKYYELLPQEEQDKLFERVKENYVQTLEDACGLDYYKEVLKNLPEWEFPLTDEECETLIKNDNTPKMYI